MDIKVLEWASPITDLNSIEKLWGYLVRKVYKDFRQFDDAESLTEAIALAWDTIDTSYFKKLVFSMPRHCAEVIEKEVGRTYY